ncbi:hypothetical protein T11_10730 [Trichinella zimbabwensis]|uniref:Uncharacterized protein n=1 Tax=Trichinella zimbabwensis TaxID=268475 RepID=A0A0V1HDR2_9BILA|nr:hypothetical protein T11_10730 [Trichinella zimbabwensis]
MLCVTRHESDINAAVKKNGYQLSNGFILHNYSISLFGFINHVYPALTLLTPICLYNLKTSQ